MGNMRRKQGILGGKSAWGAAAVLAAVLTQLGDTLATLAVQRERLNDGRGEEK